VASSQTDSGPFGIEGRPYFVWVTSPRGPQPRRVTELYWGLHDWWQANVLALHPLSDEEVDLPLDDLVKKYPPPNHRITIDELRKPWKYDHNDR
jgi:hypothetical protein